MKLNYILIIITCLCLSCSHKSETTKIIDLEEKENLNFSKIDVSKNKATAKDYLKTFTRNEDKFLNIHFTLDKPLIESLELLAPDLTENECLEKGNFQFSFLIDGVTIYEENLNKGAGSKAFKKEQLDHTIRLLAPNQLDYWGWFMWLKFMKLGGGEELLKEGGHTLSIAVRPYIKQEELKVGSLLAKGSITVEVAEIVVDERLIPIQKIQPNSGWEIAKNDFNPKKITALNRRIAEGYFEAINGIVVIKEGQLLLEEYFNGENRTTLHDSRSVGKSMASTMLGIAIQENYINSENEFLKIFYDLKSYTNYSVEKEMVTLKSLLTMCSGFDGDDSDYNSPGNEENMYPTNNWVEFTLGLPMQEDQKKAKEFTYFTAGVVVLGDVINQSVPNGLISYAEKKLFGPLDISNYQWEYTPQKVGNTAGGIRLSALDFAKYGQLYKNKGLWKGQQILTKEWVEKSLSHQVKQSIDGDYYGYLFWNKTYKYMDKEYEVSFCSGNGGNKIFIFKDIPFVVVITASAYNKPNAHLNADKMMVEYILPAIIKG
ncbi:serine hydrolase [Putridiphycobacter roseus]|uniref:Serine hydrolase n=1 Tax=Putridiphycobacter roseus TaxID=2219161 RepID=A0A2W1NQY9_9FLAO|nr:serine hydrolase [Putridiphycobacter roseus]PZE18072.1 serine hydrolase [Putridiphycobacter roseus]